MQDGLSREGIIGVIQHLWPRKQLVRGCIVPLGVDDPAGLLDSWINRCNGDINQAEMMINHVHLPDLLLGTDDRSSTTGDELKLIADAYVAFLDAEIRHVAGGAPHEIIVTGDFSKIPSVDFPDGRKVILVDAVDVEITCCLRR